MFNFDEIKNNREEAIKLTNKLIVDEIDYINKLRFMYTVAKEKYPSIFSGDLNDLIDQLNEMKKIKQTFDESIKGKFSKNLNNGPKSLGLLKAISETIVAEDAEWAVNYIWEEVDLNSVCVNEMINYLFEIDDFLFTPFASEIRKINDATIDFVSEVQENINKNKISKR